MTATVTAGYVELFSTDQLDTALSFRGHLFLVAVKLPANLPGAYWMPCAALARGKARDAIAKMMTDQGTSERGWNP